ncbi:MAG: hypothetical protein SangKO_053690 [Sandaracinaceae bacterium]
MTDSPGVETLAELSLFAGLSHEELSRLASLSEVEHWPAGHTLFTEGDAPGDLYVVREGRVTLCLRVPGKPDSCVLSLRGGELLGWSSLLRRRRVATARVVKDVELVRFGASALLELCEMDHDVGYALMRVAFEEVSDRLHQTRLQLLDIFQNPSSSGPASSGPASTGSGGPSAHPRA